MTNQLLVKKQERKLILQDSTLCAIVRDEMINPAQLPGKSGIRSFVESHAPYVEEAVIVDTGSIDGTRQELEQLASEFPNLRVYDHKFDGYAQSRNFSLAQAQTKYALVLDVDELITQNGFKELIELSRYMKKRKNKRVVSFPLKKIWPDGEEQETKRCIIDLRMFQNKEFIYKNDVGANCYEFIYDLRKEVIVGIGESQVLNAYNPLLHFKPTRTGYVNKQDSWYQHGKNDFKSPPSQCPSFLEWKQPNPHRVKYK